MPVEVDAQTIIDYLRSRIADLELQVAMLVAQLQANGQSSESEASESEESDK